MARRFVTYNTEDQQAGLVNVNEKGVMLPGGGSGLPEGGEPYMQLATDGTGKAGWEQRLAYTESNVYFEWDGSTDGRKVLEHTISPIDGVELPLTFYKVSDTYMSAEELIGSVMTVSNAETLGLPGSVTIEASNVSSGYGATSTPVLNVTIHTFPLIMSIPSEMGTNSEGVYVLLAKAETISEILGDTVENDAFASRLVKETVHYIPGKYVTPVVNVTLSADGETYTADKAYAEIAEMLSQGVFPVCVLDELYVLNLSYSTAISPVTTYIGRNNMHSFTTVLGKENFIVNITDTGEVSVSILQLVTE